jgi:hypothetical protein
VQVEMPAPNAHGGATTWRASLKEDAIAGDPFSARDVGVAYHAYSASGEVEAPVVYANSGNPADYDWLAAHGVDIKGKIALVRYSMPYSYRGFKALTAEQRGAAGILIYSDPAEDGFKKGKTYPDGPWGPESHIQRGGIVYDFRVPGDPLTPGWASVPGAKRITAAEAISLPKIMSAPLSWRDARVILEAMRGADAPAPWQGGLPITYRVGDGSTRVHLRVRMDDKVRPIWTVTGRLTGSVHPEELVIAGNHRDAWVYGGVDPSSGTASLMELARSLGTLAKQGVRPKRTIVFANWDAEEFTLTSSTEWGEQHAQDLGEHAVAYLNVDSSTSGPDFKAAAVPALNRVIAQAARDVLDLNDDDPRSSQPPRQRFGLHRVPQFSRRADRSTCRSAAVRRVSLRLRQPPVDAEVRRPGFVRHAAMTRAVGRDRAAPRERRRRAARLPRVRGSHSRVRPGKVDAARPADRLALRPLDAAADRFAAAADAAARRMEMLLSARPRTPEPWRRSAAC